MFFLTCTLTFLSVASSASGYLVLQLRQSRSREALATLAATRLQAQKRQLIQNLGHELRNPLNAIIGMCEQAQLDAGDAAQRQHDLMVIRRAADQLLMLSTNLFSYHAGEEATLPPHTDNVCVSALLDEAIDALAPLITQKQLQVEAHREEDAPYRVESDSQVLRQIVINVLAHSIGLTGTGHVTVTAHAQPNSDTLRLTVSDTGPTLSAQDSARMFEAYGLEKHLRNAVEPGTGLNLHIARKLARQLGGDVTHRAHPNAGSIYEMTVSAKTLSRAAPAAVYGSVVPFTDLYIRHRKRTGSKRVLVTEDQRSNQQLIVAILQKAGHTTTVANTGTESRTLLERETYDLAIMDLRLPGVSGLDILSLTRLQNGPNARIPFIVLTAETDDRVRQACVSAGAAAFLSKPISAHRLLDTVSAVVERRTWHDERAAFDRITTEIAVGLDSAVAVTLTPRGIAESMHDAMRYLQDATQASVDADAPLARRRIKALRGAAHALGGLRLIHTCNELLAREDKALLLALLVFPTTLSVALNETQAFLSHLIEDYNHE